MTRHDSSGQTASRAPLALRAGRFTLERRCRAPLACLWWLWTSPAGLESWWGPRGFSTRVEHLDLRPGGEWRYAIAARTPLARPSARPRTRRVCATYTEVLAPQRLRYTATAGFRGVAPYEVAVLVELYAAGEEALIVVTADALHEATLTERARTEWAARLGRLVRQARRARRIRRS